MQDDLFPVAQKKNSNTKMIGRKLSLTFNRKNKDLVTLKNYDVIVRKVDLSDKPAKKIFVIEAVELGATQSRLAEVLNISRQTIHNYIEMRQEGTS